jgi:hypothetical protein
MKIIFSRKGFDGRAGGCPSPIVDQVCLSLPIPTTMPTPITYGALPQLQAQLVADLTHGRIGPSTPCHLDPDLDPDTLQRQTGWRGALGQVAAAQGHLRNNGVGNDDVFLFWGLFRHAMRTPQWRFEGPPEHRIFGWLQVDDVVPLGSDGSCVLKSRPWLRDHPHARAGWSNSNTLYIAREHLRIGNTETGLPGWGLLKSGYRLTAQPQNGTYTASLWKAPGWLNPLGGGVGMTYHADAERWRQDSVRIVGRGQEFVADVGDRSDAMAWIENIIESR